MGDDGSGTRPSRAASTRGRWSAGTPIAVRNVLPVGTRKCATPADVQIRSTSSRLAMRTSSVRSALSARATHHDDSDRAHTCPGGRSPIRRRSRERTRVERLAEAHPRRLRRTEKYPSSRSARRRMAITTERTG